MTKKEPVVQIAQIARQVGMSPSTVSLVLNGRGDRMRIAKATQERIRETAKAMNYQPNAYARRLREASLDGTGSMICVLWNDAHLEGEFDGFLRGAMLTNEQNQYHMEMSVKLFKTGRVSELREFISKRRYNGVLIGGVFQEDATYLESETFDVPVLVTNRFSNKLSSISIDGYRTGWRSAELLSQRGIRSAGVLSNRVSGSGGMLREHGFLDSCRECGIETRPEWLFRMDNEQIANGYLAMEYFLALPQRPECLFITYSNLAVGAMIKLKEERIRVPEEMAILTYGSSRILRQMKPSVAEMSRSIDSLGREAVDLMMYIIRSGLHMPVNRVIEPVYRDGESLPPPKEAP